MFDEAIKIEPKYSTAYYNKGSILFVELGISLIN